MGQIRQSVRGFTLIESMLAAVVLAATVIGVCGLIGASYQHAAAGEEHATAYMLARQLMNEIDSKPFADPVTHVVNQGPEPHKTSRAMFDNIGDYHGYSDSSTGLVMADGTSVQVGAGTFTREVTVQYRSAPNGPAASTGDFAVVTVTVRAPGGQIATLWKLFSNVKLRR